LFPTQGLYHTKIIITFLCAYRIQVNAFHFQQWGQSVRATHNYYYVSTLHECMAGLQQPITSTAPN